MESLHLNTMVASYIGHFAAYNTSKKIVIHVIPTTIWKNVYFDY
jgi:hypothetical protein